jgi:hypothetical protein
VGLMQGQGDDGETPPTQTGHIWFLRSCVGLGFMLWSSSLSQPLAYLTGHCSGRDWGVLQTIDAYPFSIEKAPDWAGLCAPRARGDDPS